MIVFHRAPGGWWGERPETPEPLQETVERRALISLAVFGALLMWALFVLALGGCQGIYGPQGQPAGFTIPPEILQAMKQNCNNSGAVVLGGLSPPSAHMSWNCVRDPRAP